MFNPSEKFNPPKSPAQEKPEKGLGEFQERTKPLTENEQCILNNLTETAAWFNKSLKEIDNRRASPDLAKYLREFESVPPIIERPVEEKEIIESAINSDLVFLGDYHHLSKSQDFVAKTIEKIAQAPARPSILAIEFVECLKSGQKALDDYMSGKIGEEEFLKRIKFKSWDNPEHWPAYRHILESAKRSGVKVYGLNTNRKEKSLVRTDEILAENLRGVANKNPDSRIMVHVGEDHLSEDHLPRELSLLDEFNQKKSTTIFQNLSPVYFDALRKYKDFHIPKSFKLKSQGHPVYNLITAPLITELVANMEYLQLNEGYADQVEFLTADTSYALVERIVNVLGLKRREDKYDSVPPAYSSESEVERELQNFKKVRAFRPYFKILNQKGSVYMPGSKDGKHSPVLIIRRFRLKKVLEELAKFISNPEKKVEDFAQLLPTEQKKLQAFQYLCSKVFIPERNPSSESEEEEAGEKMFKDFLAGKKIEAPEI